MTGSPKQSQPSFRRGLELANLAASLKAQYNLPYANCFAAALAQAGKATLVTTDMDFERVGTALKILWV